MPRVHDKAEKSGVSQFFRETFHRLSQKLWGSPATIKPTVALLPPDHRQLFTPEKTQRFASDRHAAAYSYLLSETALSSEQVESQASTVLAQGQAHAFNALTHHYPALGIASLLRFLPKGGSPVSSIIWGLAVQHHRGTLAPSLQPLFSPEGVADKVNCVSVAEDDRLPPTPNKDFSSNQDFTAIRRILFTYAGNPYDTSSEPIIQLEPSVAPTV